MPKRTFTCSLDDSLLAACVFFLEANGAEIQGRTPSDVVELALRAFAMFLHEEDLVPKGGVSGATRYLDQRLVDTLTEVPKVSMLLKQSLRAVLEANAEEEQASTEEKEEEIAKLVSSAMDYPPATPIPPLKEVAPEEPPPIDLSSPPWEGVDTIALENIRTLSPKDVLVEQLVEKPNPALQKAVEVVYAIYPENHWGSEACMSLIGSTYEKFLPYKELLES